MQHLKAIVQKYIVNNVPFALFRYPKQAITITAQYAFPPFIENLNQLSRGFLIHPFIASEYCPIGFIRPDIYTTDFNEIDLKSIADLIHKRTMAYNETCVDQDTYLTHINKYKYIFEQTILRKAIYSRIKAFPAIPASKLTDTFLKMEAMYSNAFCYLFQLPGFGIWLGASPERLLSYQSGIARTVALAGTKNTIQKITSWGNKEKEEQAFVSKFISNLLRQFNLKLLNKSPTETIQAGNLQHLKTAFEFSLSNKKLIPFLNALHPTPAVGGYPQKQAIDAILNTEIHHRQYYTGYLGFINDTDDVDLYVNLRCAKINKHRTLAFVGGGITEDSNALLEWEETEHKSKTIGLIVNN